jgi:hypothetical protein
LPSPRPRLRLWLPSPKLGRGVGGEGKPISHSHNISEFGIAAIWSIDTLATSLCEIIKLKSQLSQG